MSSSLALGWTSAELIALATVVGMAAITYATRAGGFWLMRYIAMTPVLEAFLRGMAGSVVVAIIVPAAVKGDLAARLAIAVAVVVMLTTRQAVLGMMAGVVVAAGWRAFAL